MGAMYRRTGRTRLASAQDELRTHCARTVPNTAFTEHCLLLCLCMQTVTMHLIQLKIAERRGDVMSRFHNALYLGDAAERVAVLESTSQVQATLFLDTALPLQVLL
jgi:hypothetical protein